MKNGFVILCMNRQKPTRREKIMREWEKGEIKGVEIKVVGINRDERGWLGEVFRSDEAVRHPQMGYVSVTYPGVSRGPHEHAHQTDLFAFVAGDWVLSLWDNRTFSPTHGRRMDVSIIQPMTAVIPPGVVHAYTNVGRTNGMVLNFPDKLYRGPNKKEPVDEVRHEGNPEYQVCKGRSIPWFLKLRRLIVR
jgi:dTDP-4-dehydrorhamnose 3,5-epimerase